MQFLTKLFFYGRLGMAGMDELLEAQKKALLSQEQQLAERMGEVSEGGFDLLVLGFRLHQTRAMLDWLEDVLSELDSQEGVSDRE